MSALEANFDGLVGPTHNYAGLSPGNIASARNAGEASRPREAALQGLAKMRHLHDLGFLQGVLPPQERPDLGFLRGLGFRGSDAQVLGAVAKRDPSLLACACSASSMWSANAATVSPSGDTADGRVHFTAANLREHLHRSLEHPATSRVLRRIFADPRYFAHHEVLPGHERFGDEGAANHTRFSRMYGAPGVELFVYGREGVSRDSAFPARQTRAASEAIARLHGLRAESTVFAQQHPDAIAQGAFHNDVVAVGNLQTLFTHELALADQAVVIDQLRESLAGEGGELRVIEIAEAEVPLAAAVSSYLFNSQLLETVEGKVILLAPSECRENPQVSRCLERLMEEGVFHEVITLDLRQSMRNGGGPACLRLRVVLSDEERAAVHAPCWFSAKLHETLEAWVCRHYREELRPEDLADPLLLDESRRALDELSGILALGRIYPFQQ